MSCYPACGYNYTGILGQGKAASSVVDQVRQTQLISGGEGSAEKGQPLERGSAGENGAIVVPPGPGRVMQVNQLTQDTSLLSGQ